MKMIKELWRGNLQPIAKIGDGMRNIAELESLKERNREQLLKLLGDKNADIFKRYIDCADEYTHLISEQAFYEGFCIGMRMSSESISGSEEIIKRDCCL